MWRYRLAGIKFFRLHRRTKGAVVVVRLHTDAYRDNRTQVGQDAPFPHARTRIIWELREEIKNNTRVLAAAVRSKDSCTCLAITTRDQLRGVSALRMPRCIPR